MLGFARIIKALASCAESNNPVWIILALLQVVAEAVASQANDGDGESSAIFSCGPSPGRVMFRVFSSGPSLYGVVVRYMLCTLCRLGVEEDEDESNHRRRPNAKRQVVIALRCVRASSIVHPKQESRMCLPRACSSQTRLKCVCLVSNKTTL